MPGTDEQKQQRWAELLQEAPEAGVSAGALAADSGLKEDWSQQHLIGLAKAGVVAKLPEGTYAPVDGQDVQAGLTRMTERYQQLGEALRRRRLQMEARYSNLDLFARERGINYRLAWALEHGERPSYRRQTFRQAEIAYGLGPSWIDRFLAGDDTSGDTGRLPDSDGFVRPSYDDTWLEELAKTLEKDPDLPQRDVDGLVRLAAAARQSGARGRERRGA